MKNYLLLYKLPMSWLNSHIYKTLYKQLLQRTAARLFLIDNTAPPKTRWSIQVCIHVLMKMGTSSLSNPIMQAALLRANSKSVNA